MMAAASGGATGDTPVILFDPWPRAAPLIFTDDTRARFERLGCIVGITESTAGKLPPDLVEAARSDSR